MTILNDFLNAVQLLKGMWILRNYGKCTAVYKASIKLSTVIDGQKLEVSVGTSETETIEGGRLIEKVDEAFLELSTNAAAKLIAAVEKGSDSKVEYTLIGCSGRVRFHK